MSEPYATPADVKLVLKDAEGLGNTVLAPLIASVHGFIEEALGFTFGGDSRTRRFDADGLSDEIWLPPPGASSVSSVVVDGTAYAVGTEYELEPDRKRFLLRLDSDGYPTPWDKGRRSVVVTWTPAPPPESLKELEIIETVRLYRGQSGGFSDTIGVEGANTIVFKKAFSSLTLDHIETLKRRYLNRVMGL